MSRHRKRPAPRHQAEVHGGQPAAEQPGRHFGAALRRVIVSPTFAAGLGVVIAAMLVLPMSRTIFRYSLPGSSPTTCPQLLCPTPPSGGAHAAINGRKRIPPAHPVRHRAGPAASAQATPPAGDPTPSPASQETFSYQTVKQWPGGFMGQIMITFAPGSGKDGWRLRFAYPAADIEAVWGGGIWAPHGKHRAEVTAEPSAGVPPGQPIDVTFVIRGNPSAPARCTFNGHSCHLGG
jgi:Cellulose binding domain